MKVLRKIGIPILKLALGVGLVTWLIYSGRLDLSVLTRSGKGPAFSIWYLLFLLKPLSLMMLAWRWRRLLRSRDIHISYGAGFRLTTVGNFFSLVLPGMAAGDVIKVWDLVKNMNSRRTEVVTATLADRIIGTYALFLIGTVASGIFFLSKDLELSPELQWVLAIPPLLLLTASFFLFLALNEKAFKTIVLKLTSWSPKLEKVQRIASSLHAFKGHGQELWIATGISVLNHIFNLLLILCVGQALGTVLGLPTQFLLNAIGSAGNLIPLTPGGVGITEGIFSYLYDLSGSSKGAAISLTNRVLNYIIFIGMGLPLYVIFRKRTHITLSDLPEEERQERMNLR